MRHITKPDMFNKKRHETQQNLQIKLIKNINYLLACPKD